MVLVLHIGVEVEEVEHSTVYSSATTPEVNSVNLQVLQVTHLRPMVTVTEQVFQDKIKLYFLLNLFGLNILFKTNCALDVSENLVVFDMSETLTCYRKKVFDRIAFR